MRKLASIKTISKLYPIKDKDRIELALIDGWQVIVQKGEYQVGDKTIFVEIDSVLPEKEEFEFLRSKKFRIKTMKMGGVLSQGICFPLSFLPDNKKYKVEDDVTDILGIKKYEPSEQPQPKDNRNFITKWLFPKSNKKGFPSFISKTDEIRIQNMPFLLDNTTMEYVVREKIDGQSGTFFLERVPKVKFWQRERFNFGVCSRNMRLPKKEGCNYWYLAEKYDIENVLKNIIMNNKFVAIQGECISPKIQSNKYQVTESDLYVFNLVYPSGKVSCLSGAARLEKYGIKWCPLVDINYTLPDTINSLLDYATGQSVICPETLREGLVLRNYKYDVSFKVISPDFLIKYDE